MKYIVLGLFVILIVAAFKWWNARKMQKPRPQKPEGPEKSKDEKKPSPRRKLRWGWILIVLLLVAVGVEWLKYDFGHFKDLGIIGCKPNLQFSLQFDRSQCLSVTKGEGDGVNNLSLTFEPQKGSDFVNRGRVHVVRKDGVCTGQVLATHETAALDWEYQFVPTPCERVDDFVIHAVATEAPESKWIGNEISVTLSRKE